MNIHNKKSSVGLILTADFSEITENDLKQNTPSYPTYTMLIGLIKNTVRLFCCFNYKKILTDSNGGSRHAAKLI